MKLLLILMFLISNYSFSGNADYDTGYSDGLAVGYNSCKSRANIIKGDFKNKDYSAGYYDGYEDGKKDCKED